MAIEEALLSLRGLALGDAQGEGLRWARRGREVPAAPGAWRWTDDTHMALSVVEVLREHGHIEPDALARAFARRYVEEPWRGYALDAGTRLSRIAAGGAWRHESALAHGGAGSWGKGAAMRAAPVGAFFAGQPDRAAFEARLSARVTHAHPDGQAGAMAVAVAASLSAGPIRARGRDLLVAAGSMLPPCATREGLWQAAALPPQCPPLDAARMLGTGCNASSADTVPWCLWVAAHHGEALDAAFLTALLPPRGALDTIGAVVGGIVALADPLGARSWPAHVEPLPEAFAA